MADDFVLEYFDYQNKCEMGTGQVGKWQIGLSCF